MLVKDRAKALTNAMLNCFIFYPIFIEEWKVYLKGRKKKLATEAIHRNL
jgi:hypothetical protein